MNRISFISTQAFARSPTLASSGVRKNVHPTNKLELCWKNFILNKFFIPLLKLLFNLMMLICCI